MMLRLITLLLAIVFSPLQAAENPIEFFLSTLHENPDADSTESFGLDEESKMNHLLRHQDYIAVLSRLWSEENIGRRIDWLESKFDENHTLLFFTLAEEYFRRNPTLETMVFLSYPLIYAASWRLMLDEICTRDEEYSHSIELLDSSLKKIMLESLSDEYTMEEIESFFEGSFQKFFTTCVEYQLRILRPFLDRRINAIPSPAWLIDEEVTSAKRREWKLMQRKYCEFLLSIVYQGIDDFLEDPQEFFHQTDLRIPEFFP